MGVGSRTVNGSHYLFGGKKNTTSVLDRRILREIGYEVPTARDFQFLEDGDKRVYQKNVQGHFGCVNALEISPDERLLVSGGDDRRVLLWNVSDVQLKETPSPVAIMDQMHNSNIFSLAFSNHCDRIYSAGNDSTLFVHDIATKTVIHHVKASEAIYNISTNPIDDNMIMSSSDDGRVRMHDLRHKDTTVVIRKHGTMYCAQFNPRRPNIVSVCSRQDGLAIYDSRNWDRPWIRLCRSDDGEGTLMGRNECSVMYGQWSDMGDALFAVRSRSSPIYYNFNTGGSVEFSDKDFVNSCTVKSCSFISPNLVMTGSDDWNIYVWQVPEVGKEKKKVESAYRKLEGHRSIVNHVRYSPLNRILFSSGVEKIIKLWSEFDMMGAFYDPKRRSMLTERYVFEPRNDESMEEDLNMLSFFDALTANGGDEDMSDSDSDMQEGQAENDSEDEADELRRYLAAHGEMRGRARAYYVVSSPEMSEPELLSDETDEPSSENSTNANAALSESSVYLSEEPEERSSNNSTLFGVSLNGSSAIVPQDSDESSMDNVNNVSTTLNGNSPETEDGSLLNGKFRRKL